MSGGTPIILSRDCHSFDKLVFPFGLQHALSVWPYFVILPLLLLWMKHRLLLCRFRDLFDNPIPRNVVRCYALASSSHRGVLRRRTS